jgi:transglutaminase-like putative cysteine protease
MSITYQVTHHTRYCYESDVSDSYGQLHLLPREASGQRCLAVEVSVAPEAADYRERVDYFGNRVGYLAIHEPHRELSVTATSVVEIEDRDPVPPSLGRWEEARDGASDPALADRLDAVGFTLDSALIERSRHYAGYAARSFTPGRGLLEALTDFCSRIHREFAYAPGSTSVTTPLSEVFAERRGVCQDFAHIGIACLRSIGLPARYVSGYLETDPPPGRPKLIGADGSHAWLSVLAGATGWIDLDPTNDQLPGSRHIVTAYGRDYSDVPPLSGVIYTEGRTESLQVRVDVVAMPD